jgi:hypothetical protein
MLSLIALFLMLFALKHYLADRKFQTMYMVEGKRLSGWKFVKPLSMHCAVHAGLTFYIVLAVGIMVAPAMIAWALPCALFDFVVHFGMDRLKGVNTRSRRIKGLYGINCYQQRSARHIRIWTVIDQSVHVLTYLAIIAFLVL